ncbi:MULTISPECIES: Fe-S cluster assembly protein SufD [unclassified Fictibacillus]|uniref:Fe-S cluster assembly protein SufD n=1 Tax=unclassified Fictibacillus TaxID=2644029 RepID=UPI00223D9713|nr:MULTISPECIES: Fe-S cluster assembly protein SufD [unclassified Fictibacillus]MED2971174.1 Fe-S cluster assembly protein SufD [Fictibacillus sp. B-59209]UZJ80001.1 Fe-S cluster assembly protein SufD [Fictibacillus sp. KU28468]
MSVETSLKYDRDYVSKFSESRQEPAWLSELRLRALELAQQLPMPKPDKTKIDKWNLTEFNHVSTAEESADLPEQVKALIGDKEAGNLLVIRNGNVAHSSVTEELASQGVIFTDFVTAAQKHGDLLQKYFMKEAVSIDENRLTAIHAALVTNGAFIYVPKNVELKTPLQAIYFHDDEQTGLVNHVIIAAEDNSSVTYVENYLSTNENSESVANIVSEVFAGSGAKVVYGAVDNLAKGMTSYISRRGRAGRDARIEWALGQLNDGNTVSDNTTHLVGDGSFTDTKTVNIGQGDQKQNFVAQIFHHGKSSEGYILTHGVMKDSASSIFNGITKIEHGATKSNGEQTERVLMLSEKARGDANPILLIDEDDVTAGHAASVGRIDPIQLFYLMSRGISKAEAERLIIHGFLGPVVNEMPLESVKKRLVEVIERKVR